MSDERVSAIIEVIRQRGECSSGEVRDAMDGKASIATVKRLLARLTNQGLLTVSGQGRATRYSLSPAYGLLRPIEVDAYFEQEIDERTIIKAYNPALINDTLRSCRIFTPEESEHLEKLQSSHRSNVAQLSEVAYRKELERLAIDLSWKSSQIEGNTYSLLETEVLLRDKRTAAGRTREEAVMLLNHKEAIDFIIAQSDYLTPLTVRGIEDVHAILVKELEIGRNIRQRRVGISGTNYQPLDNEFQIREALETMCDLVNSRSNVFEKALLTLVLLSYIQPFVDGNKRTARIVSNAMLMEHGHCPLSFRSADPLLYKKAMLLFYEQNNISAFKELFIGQYEFAVRTYF